MSKSDNEVPASISPGDGEAQEADSEWTNQPVALSVSDKLRLARVAAAKGLRPSPFARMVLLEAIERCEREMAAS